MKGGAGGGYDTLCIGGGPWLGLVQLANCYGDVGIYIGGLKGSKDCGALNLPGVFEGYCIH